MILRLFMFKKVIIEFIFGTSEGEAIVIIKNCGIKEEIVT